MKQIEVTIMGQSYVLGCAEGGEAALLERLPAEITSSTGRDEGTHS